MPRLPHIYDKDELPEDKRGVFDYLVSTRGAVSHGFSVLLNNPEAASRIAQLGTYIRFESSLPDNVRELAALTASAEMRGTYEQSIHTRDAARHGVSQAGIDAINAGAVLSGLSQDEELAVRCGRELVRDRQLSPETFDQARQRFGESGVIDLIATVGYYAMLSLVHNGLEIGPP